MAIKSGKYTESEQDDTNRNGVPIIKPGIGTRIGVVADLIGSRKSAAKAADVSVASLQRYIGEEVQAPFEAIARLALAAGASLEWLATGEGSMQAVPLNTQEVVTQYDAQSSAKVSILQEVVTGVEEYLEKKKLQLSADKKGELISLLYDYFQAQGRVEKSATERFIKLVINK